jgi:hypothetical protein
VTDSLPKGYRPWLILSVSVLVGSLLMLAIAVTVAFLTFSAQSAPLWDVILGVVGVFGIAAGFAGLFLLMATAGWLSWRESRRVQILPPEHAMDEQTKG